MARRKPSEHDEFEILWSNPVTRRTLLRTAGFSLGAVALGTSIPACAADQSTQSPTDDASITTPDTISAAISYEFINLNPTVGTPGSITVNSFLYESLYRLDPFWPRTQLTPELATELPRELSPTTYRITLREGVQFHNGGEFSSDDVIFTIEQFKNPETAPLFARFFSNIGQIQATSPSEIEIELLAPTTLLAQRLGLIRGIMSRSAVSASAEALELKPVGSGPYRVTTASSGQHVTLEKFDQYSGNRKLHYNTIELSVVPDANARISGLRTNQFKIIEETPPSAFQDLQQSTGIAIESVSASGSTSISFHCSKPPFDDPRVRQAVLFAIDRDTITKTSFFDQAEPAWAGCISPEVPGAVTTSTQYRFDPQHARELLADAGYSDEQVTIDFLVASDDYITSQVPVIEENLRAVGLNPNIIPGQGEAHIARVTEGRYDAWLLFTNVSIYGAEDPEFLLRWLYTGYSPANLYHWQNDASKRVEQLLDQAISASTKDDADSALSEVQEIIQQEAPLLPIHFKRQLTAWSDDLADFKPMPTLGLTLDEVRG